MKPYIAVSTPTGRDPNWGYVISLLNLLLNGRDARVIFHVEMSSMIAQGRHRLVEYAQKEECSHILWLDDDMSYPRNTLDRLLAHDLPIIGANCTMRRVPVEPTAMIEGVRVKTTEESTGLQEVHAVGLAVMLTKTEIFAKIPLPWFATPFDPRRPSNYVGEDMFFCQRAREAGYKVMIDHDLSKEIGHIGDVEFNHSMVTS